MYHVFSIGPDSRRYLGWVDGSTWLDAYCRAAALFRPPRGEVLLVRPVDGEPEGRDWASTPVVECRHAPNHTALFRSRTA